MFKASGDRATSDYKWEDANAVRRIFEIDLHDGQFSKIIKWPHVDDTFNIDFISEATKFTNGYMRLSIITARTDVDFEELHKALSSNGYEKMTQEYNFYFRVSPPSENFAEVTDSPIFPDSKKRKFENDDADFSSPKRIKKQEPPNYKLFLSSYEWDEFESVKKSRPTTFELFLAAVKIPANEFIEIWNETTAATRGKKPRWFAPIKLEYLEEIEKLKAIEVPE